MDPSELDRLYRYPSARCAMASRKPKIFMLPTFFAVSPEYNKFRFGFSVTAPAGLSKRWQDPYPRSYAEEFSLKVIDLNPTLSYKFCDRFAVGAGVRAIYTDGKVRSASNASNRLTRNLEGDSWDAGYNLALTGRPVENMNVSVTYRSKVNLNVEGDANLVRARSVITMATLLWISLCLRCWPLPPPIPFSTS